LTEIEVHCTALHLIAFHTLVICSGRNRPVCLRYRLPCCRDWDVEEATDGVLRPLVMSISPC
jgi:hypothetical protein